MLRCRPALLQQRLDPLLGQSSPGLRRRGGGEDRQRVAAGQVGERGQRGRVELPQRRPQRVHLGLPGPDHRLMRPSRRLHVLGDVAVAGDRAVMVPVQPDDLGEHMRITRVGLRPRRGVPVPVPRRLERVDRIHRVTGRDQRLHPRTPVGLNPHQHLLRPGVRVEMISDQLMEPADPRQPFRQPGPDQPATRLVDDLNVVMGLSPVVTHEQQRSFPPLGPVDTNEPRRRSGAN